MNKLQTDNLIGQKRKHKEITFDTWMTKDKKETGVSE